MGKDAKEKTSSLDCIYKEYVRLNDQCDKYVQSSFEDFKLLGAIGALIVWPPIANLSFTRAEESGVILLMGFIGILAIISIIATRDLLKQSVIAFYMKEMANYEANIRARLDDVDTNAFRLAQNWPEWQKRKHSAISLRFRLIFFLFLFFFPITVLVLQDSYWYHPVIYGCITLIILCIYLSAVRELYKE